MTDQSHRFTPAPDALATRVVAPPRRGGLGPLVLLYAAAALAVALGWFAADGDAAARVAAEDPQLVPLLRFMAAMKGGIALGALLLAQWRLRGPAGPAALAGWVGAVALLCGGTALMWRMAPAGISMAAVHGGMLLLAATLWLDRAALGEALRARLAAARRGAAAPRP